jgi:hypothetical protein
MKFLPFIDVQLLHEYYLDRRCADFWIEPTLATQRLLNNYRCTLKATPNGVRLFTTETDTGVPLIPWRDNLTFAFHLRLRNPDFALFTNLTAISRTVDPVYTNVGIPPGNPAQLSLRSREAQPPDPSKGRQPQSTTGVFADIELHYNAPLPDAVLGPVVFQVQFEAKRARWNYYVITDTTAGRLHVEDKAAMPLRFSDNNRTDLNAQPDHSDTIASAIAEQYPQMQRLRFVSDDLISCQEAVRKTIQLRSESNQLGGALPNPSFRNYTTMQVVENGNTHTQDALFHVITYINHQSQTSGG